ncbi:CDP-glycerol glycerophosphotransferase family protein [Alkalihalobacillus sp. 1P02AB]|uniref:CDP-glycerol glycerophosphotransferase family protein n=1 Tax=Alkalihalobacillus sp. 1P02AB TaxID=3132260 RepID=UPI0039A5F811
MNTLLAKLKKSKFARLISTVLFRLISCLPVKRNVILFESFSGKQYSCNPRAIYEYMRDNKYPYELIWSVNGNVASDFQKEGIPYVRRLSLTWFWIAARAGYWVTNSRMPSWVPKPKKSTYIQTWHGTPLKRLVADMEEVHMAGNTREGYIKSFHQESSHWDYLLSPNRYSTEIFKRAFNFDKTVIEEGYPRNDNLVNKNDEAYIESLKVKIGLPTDKKIILYAPTWRDNEFFAEGSYKFTLKLELDKLQAQFGEDCIILLRLHYFISNAIELTGYEHFVYDLSNYKDINDLYLVSDLLITDYSSVFFDYANLRRPMIFYTYDMELYKDKLRGFYFDLKQEAPGPVVDTTDEVALWINKLLLNKSFNENEDHNSKKVYREVGEKAEYEQKFQAFFNRFCYLDNGQVSKRVVHQLFGETKQ